MGSKAYLTRFNTNTRSITMVVRKLRNPAPQSLSVDLEAVVSQQAEIRRAARAVVANKPVQDHHSDAMESQYQHYQYYWKYLR